jgi:hypothetical protein
VLKSPDNEESVLRLPQFEKASYAPMFFNPQGQITPGLADDYYSAARAIVERIVGVQALEGTEGTPALFLCRHYLELALKGVLFHSRWLETENRNVPRDQPPDWPLGHDLSRLWNQIEKHFPVKTGETLWKAFDTEFVGKFVAEFHAIDPNGERFRYRIEKKHPGRDPLKPLAVSWPSLLRAVEHVHDVLDGMEAYLIETYGENAEWEAEMNSW